MLPKGKLSGTVTRYLPDCVKTGELGLRLTLKVTVAVALSAGYWVS